MALWGNLALHAPPHPGLLLSHGKLTSLRPSPRFSAFLKVYYKWERERRAGLNAQKKRQQINENCIQGSRKTTQPSQVLLHPLACQMAQENVKPWPSCYLIS